MGSRWALIRVCVGGGGRGGVVFEAGRLLT